MAGFGRGPILGFIFRWFGGVAVPASGATFVAVDSRHDLSIEAGSRQSLAVAIGSRPGLNVESDSRRGLQVAVGSRHDLDIEEGLR